MLFLYFVIGVPIPISPVRLSALNRNFCSSTRFADVVMSSSVSPPPVWTMFSSWPKQSAQGSSTSRPACTASTA